MCKWRSELCPDYQCRVPAEPGSKYCIFHEPEEKDVKRFKERLRRQVEGNSPDGNPSYDFTGYDFPSGIELPSEIEVDVLFAESRVRGNVDLSSVSLKGKLIFDGATVDGSILMEDCKVGGDVSLWRVQVHGNLESSRATFKSEVNLNSAIVEEDVCFDEAKFRNSVEMIEAQFKADASFDYASFEKSASFVLARFHGEATFAGTVFRSLSLGGSAFGAEVDFSDCLALSLNLGECYPTIAWWIRGHQGIFLLDPYSRSTFWAFARRAFESTGDRERADAAHFYNRVAQWTALRKDPLRLRWRAHVLQSEEGIPTEPNPHDWVNRYCKWEREKKLACTGLLQALLKVFYTVLWLLDAVFLRLPTAYGSSLSRLFATWFLLVGGFGTAFHLLTAQGIEIFDKTSPGLGWSFGFGRALYFSVITFTTLGYGDIRPAPGLGSALTATEAILGGIMMALTVLVIGRKFMR